MKLSITSLRKRNLAFPKIQLRIGPFTKEEERMGRRKGGRKEGRKR